MEHHEGTREDRRLLERLAELFHTERAKAVPSVRSEDLRAGARPV